MWRRFLFNKQKVLKIAAMQELPVRVFDFFRSKKWVPILLSVCLFAIFGWLAARINIENDISKLIPGNSSLQKINELQAASGLYDKIVFKIKTNSANTDTLIAAADALEQKLQTALPNHIKELKLHIDESAIFDVQETVSKHLPVFLDSSDYTQFDSLLAGNNLEEKLKTNAHLLNTISGIGAKKFFSNDPLGMALTPLQRMQSLQVDERIELYEGYLFTDEQKSILLFLTLTDSAQKKHADSIAIQLQQIEDDLEANYPSAQVFMFGGLLVANGNKVQLQRDTKLTLSLTIAGILLLTLAFFRRKRIPVLMLLPAAFGLVFSLGIIYILQGNISGISLAAGSIVLGIAINYSLHYFTQLSFLKDIRQTISELWVPLTLGSFTTVASFLALTLMASPILHDFGLLAGLSLCGAALFTLFLLPQFSPPTVGTLQFKNATFFSLNPRVSKHLNAIAFLTVIVFTALLYTQISKVKFVSELNDLNYTNQKLQSAEKEILWLQNDTSKTIFIATTATNLQTALQQNEALLQQLKKNTATGRIVKYASFSNVLPSQAVQQHRITFWNNYWTEHKKNLLLTKVESALQKAGFNENVFLHFKQNFFNSSTELNASEQQQLLTIFGNGLVSQTSKNATIFSSVTIEKTKRDEVYTTIQQLPGIILLDKQIISNALVEVLYSDFNSILAYTIFIVSIALVLGYGRIELAVITFIPMLLSWIWILGIMGFLGIHFNLINIVISTFIFGLGDDFSIFISDGLIGKYKNGKPHLQTHRISILLCALATLLGLGVLYFGKHPALKSIAAVSIIGILSVFIIGQIVQPFLFNYFIQSRKEKKLAPWTLRTLLLAIGAFTYFTFTALLLTLIGFVLLYALPFISQQKRKLWYHHILRFFVKSLVYLMANVRKVHIDKHNMDFSKPAVIIANHSSFLDILVIAMQHPKLILLTNKWVFYSPVFGKVVQLADYYPVMEGVDPAIEKFEKIVAQGYSIAVFPEGTRTPDGKLKRFHKGAFFLAEKLHLDIAPLVLHGIHHTMQKGDFMLFDGTMTMKFLPRITPQDTSYGNGYAERAKNISKLFKSNLATLKTQIETHAYFAQKLVSNYYYKGFAIERAAKKFTQKTPLINILHSHLPQQGSIVELHSGYGFFTFMLYLLESSRNITSVESNEEQRSIAANCYMANEQLSFLPNINAVQNRHFDAVLAHGKDALQNLAAIKYTYALLLLPEQEASTFTSSKTWENIGSFNGTTVLKSMSK